MALELGPHGIRVNAVAPGFTPHKRHWERRADAVLEKAAYIPLGRPGYGEDVAAAIAFLASDAAAYITGQVIGINGGLA
jgi:NAD(P)-dependent dehydrogenase (short-subunit alcohol dehydrogenase family)